MVKYVVAILHIVGVDFLYVGAIIKINLSFFFLYVTYGVQKACAYYPMQIRMLDKILSTQLFYHL
jgi:hypothetical protein